MDNPEAQKQKDPAVEVEREKVAEISRVYEFVISGLILSYLGSIDAILGNLLSNLKVVLDININTDIIKNLITTCIDFIVLWSTSSFALTEEQKKIIQDIFKNTKPSIL